MKESKVPGGIQTHSGEGQVILSQQLSHLATDTQQVLHAIQLPTSLT